MLATACTGFLPLTQFILQQSQPVLISYSLYCTLEPTPTTDPFQFISNTSPNSVHVKPLIPLIYCCYYGYRKTTTNSTSPGNSSISIFVAFILYKTQFRTKLSLPSSTIPFFSQPIDQILGVPYSLQSIEQPSKTIHICQLLFCQSQNFLKFLPSSFTFHVQGAPATRPLHQLRQQHVLFSDHMSITDDRSCLLLATSRRRHHHQQPIQSVSLLEIPISFGHQTTENFSLTRTNKMCGI